MKLNYEICKKCNRCQEGWCINWIYYRSLPGDGDRIITMALRRSGEEMCKFNVTKAIYEFFPEFLRFYYPCEVLLTDDINRKIFSETEIPIEEVEMFDCPFFVEHFVKQFDDSVD